MSTRRRYAAEAAAFDELRVQEDVAFSEDGLMSRSRTPRKAFGLSEI